MLLTKFAYPSRSCTQTFQYLLLMVGIGVHHYRKTCGVPAVWHNDSGSRQGARLPAYAIANAAGYHQFFTSSYSKI